MKTIIKFSFVASIMLAFISCSDDDKKNTQKGCECHYTLVEGGQPLEGWSEPSDSTDCNLDNVKVYYQNYMNGQPINTYYRVLHCSEKN